MNNGPAFPTPYLTRDGDHYDTEYESGMTLRDYFAAKAMQAFLHGAVLPPGFDATEQLAFAAQRAYEVAAAMLAARGAA